MSRFYVVLAMVALSAAASSAVEFRTLGPRAMGMGGAGVASSRRAYAVYYNPAALAAKEDGAAPRIAMGGAAGVRDVNVVDSLDALSDYEWEDLQDDPAAQAAAIADVVTQLERLGGGLAMAGANGNFYAAAGRFGAGASFDARITMNPHVDLVHTNATGPADPNSFAFNTSAVRARALALTEVPLAAAYAFDFGGSALLVGGAAKFLQASTYAVDLEPTESSSDDVTDRIRDSERTSSNIGLDVGVLYNTPFSGLSVGLVARNLNQPSFDTADGDLKEKAQARAGIEWTSPSRVFTATLDADLTSQEPLHGDYESRWIGGGIAVEGTLSIFALGLRLGAARNVAESDPGMIYTGGMTFGLKWFHLSVAAAASSDESTYEDTTAPSEVGVAVALESTW
jgi:hypothetical protein